MAQAYHIPVLLHKSVQGLNINPAGDYVDVTFGGGGHSREILSNLKSGRLFAFDQDEDATVNIINDNRFFFIRHNFKYIRNFLKYYKIKQVNGILADLGVSSHDFDVAERGFSFRFEGELDMRMNRESKKTAANIVNNYPEDKLFHIFKEYGEIKNAFKLSKEITKYRSRNKIKTIDHFKKAIAPCTPPAQENKYLAKVFQALRIETNQELSVLKSFLLQTSNLLKPGGRLVIITYHSLEDRLVKNFMKSGNISGKQEKDFYGNVNTPFELITRKIITPSKEEIKQNPRARSAKLRIAEKIG